MKITKQSLKGKEPRESEFSRLANDHNVFARTREGIDNGQETKLCLEEQDHAILDRNSAENSQDELDSTHNDEDGQ